MRNTAIAFIAAVAVLASAPGEAAQKSRKNEHIGVGTGALIGAAAGGRRGDVPEARRMVGDAQVRHAESTRGLRHHLEGGEGHLLVFMDQLAAELHPGRFDGQGG